MIVRESINKDWSVAPYLKIVKTWSYKDDTHLNFKSNDLFLLDACGFNRVLHPNSGLYVIGGFYVGKSNNIRGRLLKHFLDVLNDRHYNSDFSQEVIKRMEFDLKRLRVQVIDEPPTEKNEMNLLKRMLGKGMRMTNKMIPSN